MSPRSCAVCGMNCAMPSAPAGLTAAARKLLSRQMMRVRNPTGRSLSRAELSISRQIAWSSGSIVGTGCATAVEIIASRHRNPAMQRAQPMTLARLIKEPDPSGAAPGCQSDAALCYPQDLATRTRRIDMAVRLVVSITAAPGKGAELAQAMKGRCEISQKDQGCEHFEVFQ